MSDLEIARSLARRRFALMDVAWVCHNIWPLQFNKRAWLGSGPPPVSAIVEPVLEKLSSHGASADPLRPILETCAASLFEDAGDEAALRDVLAQMISDLGDKLAELPKGAEKAKGALLGLIDVTKTETDQILDAMCLLREHIPPEYVVRIVSDWKRNLEEHLERESTWAAESGQQPDGPPHTLPRTPERYSMSHIFWWSSSHLATLDAVSRYLFMEGFDIGEFATTRRQIEGLVREALLGNEINVAREAWLASRSPKLVAHLAGAVRIALDSIMESQSHEGWWSSVDGRARSGYQTALSAIVLLRLGRSDSHRLAGRDGADWLANRQLSTGAWRAVDQEDGGESCSGSLLTTTLAATAIAMAGADRYASTLALATDWILSEQEPTGTWPNRPLPSPFISVLAVEFLEGRVQPLDVVDAVAAVPEAPIEAGEAASENVFRKQGDAWFVRYGGVTRTVSDVAGMRYIWYLLCHTGEEFEGVELVQAVAGEDVPEPTISGASAAAGHDDAMPVSGLTDAGDVADREAIRAVEHGLDDLRNEHRDALQRNDSQRADALAKDIWEVENYLRGAKGLHGRPRKADDQYDRAGNLARTHIRRALERIERQLPDLCLHLRNAIKTSPRFTYCPDRPTEWSC